VAQIDRNNNQQLEAKTIAVAVMTYQTGLSYPGDPAASIGDIGSGKAYIFTDGVVHPGTWAKASRTDRLTFTDANGQIIPFNRGSVWVEIVPPNTGVEY
jgi:hypothetical protein